MTDTVFALITDWGAWVILASAFLSCLALPIPTSMMMLAGGAFIASGDLAAPAVIAAAFGGAVVGDQTGFFLGRWGGAPLLERLSRNPTRKAVIARARKLVEQRGGTGVFLSTWALAPLGPWVNFVAGATGLGWRRFSLADITGEAIWVTLYVGLGFAFGAQIEMIADLIGNIVGLLVALVVAGGALWWIRAALKAQKARHAEAP